MEVVVTTGALSRANLQPESHHQQTQLPAFYRPDALPVAQPTVSEHCKFHQNLFTGFRVVHLTLKHEHKHKSKSRFKTVDSIRLRLGQLDAEISHGEVT